jgi:DNA-binding transcriptional LysR family regulator
MSVPFDEATGGFTIERLRTFCRIAAAGSIAQAAKGDPTRQSQFSRQVKELEEFFGTKLVERAGKTVRLTEAGRTLAVLTQSYFRSVEELRQSSTQEEVIHLGAGESVFRWLLMPRLAELQGQAQGVRFEFHTQGTAQCLDGVKAGRLDLAIVRKDAADDSLGSLPCGTMRYTLVVPRKLLPGRTAAGLESVRSLPFALLTGDGVLANGVLKLAAKNGLQLDVKVKAENFSLVVSAIQNADLATVLPAGAVAGLSKERFATVEMEGIETLTRDLVLVYSPQASELRQSIRRLAPRIASLLDSIR